MQQLIRRGVPLREIAPTQSVGGRARKESLIDTVCYTGGAALSSQLKVFNDFGAFANVPATSGISKTEGRDTNLTGNGGIGLPSGHAFEWYQWRHAVLTYGTNRGTTANYVVDEEIHRFLMLLHCQFKFQQTVHIIAPGHELPQGTGPAWGSVAATGTNATPVTYKALGPNGIPDRKGKVITIGNDPISIEQLQNFGVINFVQQGAFSPTVDLFSQHILDGVLTRALV